MLLCDLFTQENKLTLARKNVHILFNSEIYERQILHINYPWYSPQRICLKFTSGLELKWFFLSSSRFIQTRTVSRNHCPTSKLYWPWQYFDLSLELIKSFSLQQ